MTQNLSVPYDSRWPAILQAGEVLELTPDKKDDCIRDVAYTTAVWQAIQTRVIEERLRLDVANVKRIYKIGCGGGFSSDEILQMGDHLDLLFRKKSKHPDELAHWPRVTDPFATPDQVLRQVEEAPSLPVVWPGDNTRFLKQCAVMARRWGSTTIPVSEPYPKVPRDCGDRCQMAADMTIGSMTIATDPKVTVAWINHRGNSACAELAQLKWARVEPLSPAARNLVCCFIDLAFEQEWREYALRPGPPRLDPTARPTAEMEALLKDDPPCGVARHLLPRPPGVPAHFIAPPPRRIRIPRPPPQRVQMLPRIAPGQKAGRRMRHEPGSFSSYGREVPTDEETEEERAERAEATQRLAEQAASAAGQAAEQRYQYVQSKKAAAEKKKSASASASSASAPAPTPKETARPATPSKGTAAEATKAASSPVLRRSQPGASPQKKSPAKSPA